MPHNVTGLHHIGLPVHDFVAARRFYGEILGLEETERPASLEKLFPGVWYHLGGSDLHLFLHEHHKGEGSPFSHHLAFSVTDFDAAVAALRSANCNLEREPMVGPDGLARAFVWDPSGNLVELTDGTLPS